MRHQLFGHDLSKVHVALLIKETGFIIPSLISQYITPLVTSGVSRESIIGFTLDYETNKKASASFRKKYLDVLLAELDRLGVDTLYVADGEYFKTLTKNTKAEPHLGYVLPCAIDGYAHMQVILGVNYQALVYNPTLKSKLALSLNTLSQHIKGSYTAPGQEILTTAIYPDSLEAIARTLDSLHQFPSLTCDIEGFSLKFYECGIGSISFAWNEHEGVSFPCDYRPINPAEYTHSRGVLSQLIGCDFTDVESYYGLQQHNKEVKALIKKFLTEYQGTLIYHNAGFDIKVLIYELWMNDLADYKGMLEGIDVLTRNFEDTKLLAYLALNNAVSNDLSLKTLAHTFAGNYAQENINDIRLIPLDQLLQYNLIDGVSTWYVYNKYLPLVIQEEQYELYQGLFKDSVKVILQIELVGMPIDPAKVQEAKITLEKIVAEHNDYLQNCPTIKDFHYLQLQARVEADNKKLKTKVRTIEELAHIKFNPGSDKQLQDLIYDYLGYEVIDTTDSGAPAVGGKTLKKLINHAKTDRDKEIFQHLIGLSKADKILTSFIPAFEQAQRLPDGSYRLYGNFNLGGTQSGRLSSSNPNLQNIPSGSAYAKIIKQCFISPLGWLFCGADFTALEAMGEALLSRDPNKLKVYIDGYDSHCVNAYAYFSDEMPDIVDTVDSINSIKKLYKDQRGRSKAPTFALQYKGTWRTVMKSAGVSEEMAKKIEANYQKLYQVSIAWIDGILDKAHETGYVEGAFGLKIRTPILQQTPLGGKLSFMAEAERRSAGNAKTQSYGLLNNRAAVEFRKRVDASPYRYDIFLVSLIHDATYILCRNHPDIIKWVNDNLVACMRWQELPELQHDVVKLGAELDIYWPSWADALTLPNNISKEEIIQRACAHKKKLMEETNE